MVAGSLACVIVVIKWHVSGKHPLESAHESLLNNFVFFENAHRKCHFFVLIRITVITAAIFKLYSLVEEERRSTNGCSVTCRFRFFLPIMEYGITFFDDKNAQVQLIKAYDYMHSGHLF